MADDEATPAPPAKAARGRDDRPEPTHDLVLADGSTAESFGAIPTHVAVGDRRIPVLTVTERQ